MMKTTKLVATFATVGLLGVMTAHHANASQWNQKTTFTFSGPVEVPGTVLGAGTYVFKLLNSTTDRNIVQIFNKNQTHIYATVLAIPDYRLKATGKTILTFAERPTGSPEAVKAWFYPGDRYGQEFVYPKAKAVALAKQNNQPVPSMPDEMASETNPTKMQQVPLKAEKPTGEEVEVGEIFVPAPPASNQQQPTTEVAQSAPPAQLPKTASDMPLIGLMGLLALAGAGSLKLVEIRRG
jgi:hypothetical protein